MKASLVTELLRVKLHKEHTRTLVGLREQSAESVLEPENVLEPERVNVTAGCRKLLVERF
jgi:hypothetical protein